MLKSAFAQLDRQPHPVLHSFFTDFDTMHFAGIDIQRLSCCERVVRLIRRSKKRDRALQNFQPLLDVMIVELDGSRTGRIRDIFRGPALDAFMRHLREALHGCSSKSLLCARELKSSIARTSSASSAGAQSIANPVF